MSQNFDKQPLDETTLRHRPKTQFFAEAGHYRKNYSHEAGVQRVRVNLTQLLELWVRNKIANHGLLLVSHRRQVEKTLCSDKVILPVEPRLSIKIFYTELD